METPVEIRYAGVVVARANEVRRMTVGGVDLFLAMPEPLPAGTVVSLGTDQQARIEKVIESADPSVAGVYVRLLAEGEASQPWVPSFREAEVPAPRPPAVVVSPVIVRPVHAPSPPRPSIPTPREVAVPVRAPEPVVETPLPEVVASVVEEPRVAAPPPIPPVLEPTAAEPPQPFTAPMPAPGEQIAMFDAPAPPPPPAVIEHAQPPRRDRMRSTIVVAVAPPADEERVAGAVKAVGEIDTGSRKISQAHEPSQGRPTIMVETEDYQPAAAPEPEQPPAEPARPTTELRLEDLSTARPLPSARGRATKRRRTTQR